MAGANATLPATLGALQNELRMNLIPGASDVNTGELQRASLPEPPLPPAATAATASSAAHGLPPH